MTNAKINTAKNHSTLFPLIKKVIIAKANPQQYDKNVAIAQNPICVCCIKNNMRHNIAAIIKQYAG